MNETSLMRVEFKYENKAVPTASLAGTEALRCRGGGGAAVTRRGQYRAIIARDALLANCRQILHRHSTLTPQYSLLYFTSDATQKTL